MRLLNTAIIRLCLIFIAGIITGFYIKLPLRIVFILTGCSFLTMAFLLLRSHRKLFQNLYFGLFSLLLFFFLGAATVQLHIPENQAQHYTNLQKPSASLLLLSIKEAQKANRFNDIWVAEVQQVNGEKSFGKILLQLPKDSFDLKADDLLIAAGMSVPIAENLNPQRFSYKKFLANRGILHRIHPDDILPLELNFQSLQGTAENLRQHITTELKRQPIGPEEQAIIQALLLGQRNEISPTMEEQYASAGVMHLLAVSGLHIGIILLLLNSVLAPLSRWRFGRSLKILLLISLLWGYALIAGLSPSIIRAVTMFSFLAIGMQLKRQTSALNSLFLSLFLLLTLNPYLIYEVGFQLSYIAVIAIVLLQPHLYGLFSFQWLLPDYLWKILSVSLAAQLGVLPLSLYYFHQFPGLFFLSNLVILPFLGFLLGLGLVVILLTLLQLLPTFLSRFYHWCIESLNSFVVWVAQQEHFLFTDIPYSTFELLAFYFLLGSLFLFFQKKTFRYLHLLLAAVLILQGATIYQSRVDPSVEVVIFHRTKHTLIGERTKTSLRLAHNLTTAPEDLSFLKSYKVEKRLKNLQPEPLRNLYQIPEGLLLVVDSTGIYRVPELQPQKVLLINSPKINLDRLLRELQPTEVIADGSNYLTAVKRWEKTCVKNKTPFHYTGSSGAWTQSTASPTGKVLEQPPKKIPFHH